MAAEGWAVNKKRVERLWRQEGLQVPPRRVKASGGKGVGQDANSAWGPPHRSFPVTGRGLGRWPDDRSQHPRTTAPLRVADLAHPSLRGTVRATREISV
ncbi:hypothetical protein ACPPVS_01350 [Cellulomonas sp. McL0617]|uniref:hypothetical protein n=1 Tax=Cellulomonas sp. McL0617 TaxID=3415675 RepID=UPI003CF2B908